MNIDYPFRFNGLGKTASTGDDDHIRDLIEQVLFTNPGERINRPGFGSGLLRLIFEPNSTAIAAATRLSAQAALQQWMGDLIEVKTVEMDSDEATLRVTVEYTVRRTQQRAVAQFQRGGPA